MLWENGVPTKYNSDSKNAEARSVYVIDNNVYMAGNEEDKAMLWKNGIPTTLDNNKKESIAYSVYIIKRESKK